MDGIEVLGLESVIFGLQRAPELLAGNVAKAVTVTSHKIRDDARSRISGYKYLPKYPGTISYEVRGTDEAIEGEIGPERSKAMNKRQASLGALLEFGSVHNAPIPHLGPALDANANDLFAGVEIAVRQALA